MNPRLTHFACAQCRKQYPLEESFRLCDQCKRPLLAHYDLSDFPSAWTSPAFVNNQPGMWRYAAVLPFVQTNEIITLGEGMTPLLKARALQRRIGLEHLYFKDEGQNPTGSFKARGMSVAVSAAKYLQAKAIYAPSAGNAGVAMAAYGAAAGLPVHIAFPQATPPGIVKRAQQLGAQVQIIPGSIAEAGKKIRQEFQGKVALDLSTFREPFRVEGKKTMGYELFEQLGGALPDAVIYPAGGGTGVVALAKAMEEMQAIGWIGKQSMRIFIVQAEGCAPLVNAFAQQQNAGMRPENPRTIAHGLRVPETVADTLILQILHNTHGGAVQVSDEEIVGAVADFAKYEGLLVSPEAAATLVAAAKLMQSNKLDAAARTVLFLTASAFVYGDGQLTRTH